MNGMLERPLRAALIGCGFFAQNHLHGWRQVSGAEITAVCDTDEGKARAYAEMFQIAAVYTNPRQMLDQEDLDFVDIVTPPSAHRALVELAAEYKVHAICQKPMAPSIQDAKAMIDACNGAGIELMIHENYRWQPAMREVYQISRQLGDLYYGRFTSMSGYDVYADQPYLREDPRFIIYDLGVHLFDLVRFFMGEATEIVCHTKTVNPRIKGEDVAIALIKMKSGASCVVEMSYAAHPAQESFPQTLVYIEGSSGSVKLDQDFEITQVKGSAMTLQFPPPRFTWSSAPAEAVQASIPPLQQHWVDCLSRGVKPETSGEDNVKTLAMVFAAYESADSAGKPVQLAMTSK